MKERYKVIATDPQGVQYIVGVYRESAKATEAAFFHREIHPDRVTKVEVLVDGK